MIRDIKIHAVLNGWIVTVGCQQIVFTESDHLLKQLGRYLINPKVVEKEYRELSVNSALLDGCQEEIADEGGYSSAPHS